MIKYSDCSNGYKYGTDGKQLANWNADKDYGEEYAKVYFRIDTPIYQYHSITIPKKIWKHSIRK